MINQDLLKYIESEFSKGTLKEAIQSNLISNGWDAKDVAEGFLVIGKKNVPQQPVINPVPASNSSPNINPTFNISPNINLQNPIKSASVPNIKINLPNTSGPTISQSTISSSMAAPSMLAKQDFQKMSASQIEPQKSHPGRIFIIIFIILLVLAGSGFVYYKYFSSNFSQNNKFNGVASSTSEIVSTSSEEQNNFDVTSTSSQKILTDEEKNALKLKVTSLAKQILPPDLYQEFENKINALDINDPNYANSLNETGQSLNDFAKAFNSAASSTVKVQ